MAELPAWCVFNKRQLRILSPAKILLSAYPKTKKPSFFPFSFPPPFLSSPFFACQQKLTCWKLLVEILLLNRCTVIWWTQWPPDRPCVLSHSFILPSLYPLLVIKPHSKDSHSMHSVFCCFLCLSPSHCSCCTVPSPPFCSPVC